MEKINTDGLRARLWSHNAHVRAMRFYPRYISHDRLPIPELQYKIMMGSRPWGITEGKFFTYCKIMRAQSHAVLLNGLFSLFFSFFLFFFFFAQSIQCVQWQETTAFSHIIRTLPGVHVSSLQNTIRKPEAHIQHTIHKQQNVSWFNHHHHYTNNSTRMKV